MSYSRYNIELKQVSTDRGVTWTDTTETRLGQLEGITNTILECEDMACELEEYRYEVIDGELPTEICGEFILPEGIAKKIKFTAGAICDNTWQWCNPTGTDYISGREVKIELGKRRCGGGYCPGFTYYEPTINGLSLTGCCVTSYPNNWETCTCLQITEFMPWAEGKETWKMIEKKHYVREHCSDEWIEEGEPEIVGIAERWKFVSDNFYTETWQHQVATGFDENGNVTEWSDSGSTDVTYYNSNLPAGVQIIRGINPNGVVYCANSVFKESLSIELKVQNANSGGTVLHSEYHYYNSSSGRSIAVSDSDSMYWEQTFIIIPTSEYQYYRNIKYERGSIIAQYGCLFGKIVMDTDQKGHPYIRSVSNLLNGITAGRIRQYNEYMSAQDMNGTYFPYMIDAGNGQYEYGYILRDGTMYPLTRKE